MSTTVRAFAGLLLLTLPLATGCCTIAGGLLGGGTGAIVGGGAGLLCGEPVEGAKNGAAFGAGTGMITGAVCDAVILSPFAIVSNVLGCDKSHEALTAKEIEQLFKAGVDDQVIITQIRQVGMEGPLSVKEIVRLKDKGVSPAVIQVAQQHPNPLTPSMVNPTNPTNATGPQQLANSKPATTTPSSPSPVVKAMATEPVAPPSDSSTEPTPAEAFRLFETTPGR